MSAQLEEEKKECEAQLDLVNASLRDDPSNAELLALRAEVEQMLQLLNESIAELQPPAPAPAPPKHASYGKKSAPPLTEPPPEEPQPKWSRENHPAFKKAEPAAEEQQQDNAPVVYQVNDNVLARWMSGDKGFYPARITSITGSKTAPIYTVKFKSYDTVETLRGKDIKPVVSTTSAAGQKRKAEGSSTGPSPSASANVGNNGIVLSAGQELYPHAVEQQRQQQQQQEEKNKGDKYDEQGRPKFKKIKAKKELEVSKNKWQEFNAKGKVGKTAKKESMFRTPEGPKGRVGFTGSGQAMRKDPTRTRHVYQPNEEVD